MRIRKMIAVVDNDTEFVKKFRNTLKKLNLSNKFHAVLFGINVEEDIPKCIQKLRQAKGQLVAIMIDIVIFEMADSSELLAVVRIFREIRREFPSLPIFFVTKHIEEKYLPLVSWCSLEDIDGILFKQYLYLPEKDKSIGEKDKFHEYIPFTDSDIAEIFQEAKRKRGAYMTASILSIPENVEKDNYKIIKELLHPDERSLLQIREMKNTIFIHLIDELFGEQTSRSGYVTVSYLRPGFSGSYLFKIDVHKREKKESYLMKINNDEKIKLEFDNHKKVHKIMSPRNHPATTGDYVNYGNWGALGIEIQQGMITLLDYLCMKTLEENHIVIANLGEILSQLYRSRDKKPMRLWKDRYNFSSRIYLQLLAFFEDRKKLLQEFIEKEKIEELEKFVFTQGKDLRLNYEKLYNINIGNIHGDLNARNVLVHPESKQVVLIDYANMDETGHLTRDIAKLEADLIFSVLHSNSKKFYDWNSVAIWEALFDLLDLKNIFDFDLRIATSDARIEKTGTFIVGLRKSLKEDICPHLSVGEYLNSLLYYSFHYLVYPDISIQKKVFATKWLSRIITQLKNVSANP